MSTKLAPLVFIALAFSLPAFGAGNVPPSPEKKLLPIDEARKDDSWVVFRNRLLEALARRDRKFLLSIVDRNIRNSLDAPPGADEFRKQWEIDTDTSPIWRELPSALFLGSAWRKPENGPRQLCAPYVAVKWPEDVDPFDNGAVTAREALVKADPSSASRTLARLSYDIVPVVDWEVADADPGTKQRWVRVRIGENDGFVPEEQIRSPIEHRACFVKTEQGWRMVAFVVGVER